MDGKGNGSIGDREYRHNPQYNPQQEGLVIIDGVKYHNDGIPQEKLIEHLLDPETVVELKDNFSSSEDDLRISTKGYQPHKTNSESSLTSDAIKLSKHLFLDKPLVTISGIAAFGAMVKKFYALDEYAEPILNPIGVKALRVAASIPGFYLTGLAGKHSVKQFSEGHTTFGMALGEATAFGAIASGAAAGFKPAERALEAIWSPSVFGGALGTIATSYLVETGVGLLKGEKLGSASNIMGAGKGLDKVLENAPTDRKVIGADMLGLAGITALGSVEMIGNGIMENGYTIPSALQKPLTKFYQHGGLNVALGTGVLANTLYFAGKDLLSDLKDGNYIGSSLRSVALGAGVLGSAELFGSGFQKFSSPAFQKLGTQISKLGLSKNFSTLGAFAALNGAAIFGKIAYDNLKEEGLGVTALVKPSGGHFGSSLSALTSAALGIQGIHMISKKAFNKGIWGPQTLTALGIAGGFTLLQGVLNGFSAPTIPGVGKLWGEHK